MEDSLRTSATSRKCRASKVEVLAIFDANDQPISWAESIHDPDFIYKIGDIIEVGDFNEDRWYECAPGIHHYLTKQEAILHD